MSYQFDIKACGLIGFFFVDACVVHKKQVETEAQKWGEARSKLVSGYEEGADHAVSQLEKRGHLESCLGSERSQPL